MSPLVRFLTALVLLGLLLVGGTVGYTTIEGWSLRESAYMTVITITTVGFAEVRPLSPQGQSFTIALILFSIFTAGYSVTVLVTYIFEGQIAASMKERRMSRRVHRMRDHVIVCGAGDVGREVVQELRRAGTRFVVVDRNPSASELADDDTVLFVQGDAAEDEILEEAGLMHARGLVAALPEDESNLFVVFTARQLNPSLNIVTQASEERAIRKLRKAGANRVISPKQIAGQRMASLIGSPSLVSFLDIVARGDEVAMQVEEVGIPQGSPLVGKTLREAGVGRHTGAIIVAINGPDGWTRMNPSSVSTLSAVRLNEGDTLIAVGNDAQLERLRAFVQTGR